MDKAALQQLLHRAPESHKYTFGHVLVVGGSPGMVGAPLLSGMAALRTGAGLVTIASEQAVIERIAGKVPEIMTLELPKASGEANAVLQQFIADRKVSVLVLGPGLTASPQLGNLVGKLIEQETIPVIIDGGALGTLHNQLDALQKSSNEMIILTPHVGEFERLVEEELPDSQAELKPIATQFAEVYGVHLVLKGNPTYIAHPNGATSENTSGNPGLATAGTGDVLTGVVAGMIAQNIGHAIEMAVYFHGVAGNIAAEQKTQPSMIATDVIESIPVAYKRAAR
jgi:hydroxyethylthiazole kinase-like uncharacterized protein yjeF